MRYCRVLVSLCFCVAAAPAFAGVEPLGGDCDDTNAEVYPDHAEIAGNRIDDDCDGLADEAADGTPSSDTGDTDVDGQSIAAGDCNDVNMNVANGTTEVPGDLIDNDCDGLADEAPDGSPSGDMLDHDDDGVTIGSDRLFASGFEADPD